MIDFFLPNPFLSINWSNMTIEKVSPENPKKRVLYNVSCSVCKIKGNRVWMAPSEKLRITALIVNPIVVYLTESKNKCLKFGLSINLKCSLV